MLLWGNTRLWTLVLVIVEVLAVECLVTANVIAITAPTEAVTPLFRLLNGK